MSRRFRVSELAELSGVSVRTLHYYDEIGLLSPSDRTGAGYRLYDESELLRLQQILIRRELGFSLAQIGRALDDPGFDQRAALVEQRTALAARADQARDMIRSIDAALSRLDATEDDEERQMTQEPFPKELFDGFDPAEYEDEVKERYGEEAHRLTSERVANYTRADWEAFRNENGTIYSDMFALLQSGEPADSEAAMDVAERHRLSIDRWFYSCNHQMHAGLADLYEADGRFADSIDKFGDGLTPYLSAAIRANAARQR